MHWQRWQRHGDPTIVKPHPGPRTDPIARFWSKVDKSDAGGCWPWTGSRDRDGYGYFKVDRKGWRASRFSFNLANDEPLLDDEMVRHTCDNPPCVNPAHLIRGSAAENMGDQLDRGRNVTGDRHHMRREPERSRGESNAAARLTEDQVRAIRTRYATGMTQVALAIEYGVTQSLVSQIVRRVAWTHLE